MKKKKMERNPERLFIGIFIIGIAIVFEIMNYFKNAGFGGTTILIVIGLYLITTYFNGFKLKNLFTKK